ncbi:hypothetical protein EBZ39_08755 [bacterium]|nr:hypothetical protein [bacterium]
MDIQIGDGITALHQGKVINGDVVKIRSMMDGSTLQERAMITVKEDGTENRVSFYPDECEGIDITPAYTRPV